MDGRFWEHKECWGNLSLGQRDAHSHGWWCQTDSWCGNPLFSDTLCVFKIELERFLLSSLKWWLGNADIKGIFPSTFHIRCGGYKGVVAQNPNFSKKLSLGSRMKTFYSDHTKLDALAWTKEQPCFLNRQMISILSTLGVSDNVSRRNLRKLLIR